MPTYTERLAALGPTTPLERRRWRFLLAGGPQMTEAEVRKFCKQHKVSCDSAQGFKDEMMAYFRRHGTFKNLPRNKPRRVYTPARMQATINLEDKLHRVTPASRLLAKAQRRGIIQQGGRSPGHFKDALLGEAHRLGVPLKYGSVKGQPRQQTGDADKRVDACFEWVMDMVDGKLNPRTTVHLDEFTKFHVPPPMSECACRCMLCS